MKPTQVKEIVKNYKHMNLRQGQYVYDFITKNNLSNILELGFYHGVSSIYLAGAAQDLNGKLTTIDLISAKEMDPNIETLLKAADLEKYVEYYYEPKSYTWRLMRMLQEHKSEIFDFVYIDGGHNWDNTGYAFFLVSKLLKKNGWILFDDLNWTIEKGMPPSYKDRMPLDMYTTPQVGLVYDLLVKTDNRYSNHFIPSELPNWGLSQKIV